MTSYLTNLEKDSSESIASAISVQIEVIKYISSPNLIDGTFDLILQKIKKSVSYANSPKENDDIKEKGTLIIQNYIFFSRAKLQYAMDKNKEEAREIYKIAINKLVENTIHFTTQGNTANLSSIVHLISSNLLSKEDNSKLSFIDRTIDWLGVKTDNNDKKNEFYRSLDNLINKLNRRFDIIGKSNIIAGLISNYAPDLTNYKLQSKFDDLKTKKREGKQFDYFIIITSALLALTALFTSVFKYIFSRIYHFILNIFTKEQEINTNTENGEATLLIFVAIFFIIYISYFIYKTRNNKECRKIEKEISKQEKEIYQSYLDISERFEEL